MIELLQSSPGVFVSVALIFGLLIGSFLNVVIYRLPVMMQRAWRADCITYLSNQEPAPGIDKPEYDRLFGALADATDQSPFNLVFPRSACPSCGHAIRSWENVPLLSYLFLRGRCAQCRTTISPRYPAIELITGLASAAIAWRFGFGVEAAVAMLLSWSLIALTMIDFDHQLLPDSITLPLLWLGLGLSLFHDSVTASVLFISPRDSIIGAIAGYALLRGVYELFKLVTGKEGMGFGDFKLLAALGAWLGWKLLPLIIMLSAVVGAAVGIGLMVFKRHGREVPIAYGPYLAAAGWVALMWGDELMRFYSELVSL
ncbi:MAG: prepilin peptidase [Gammaproteobacteria bacterium]|nr:prepilin peptidase [Gammaproteobacteria bacterium]